MSNTYTSNVKLAQPATGDPGWGTTLNGDLAALDALAPLGQLAVTSHEQPSASLTVDIAAGNYGRQDGSIATYSGVSARAVTASTTNYLYLDLTASGALVVNTTGFPAAAHVRLAVVTAGSSTLTGVSDQRVAYAVFGHVADGVNVTLGTVSGTQFGTGASQKLGFFGATPVVQQAGGAATASSSWTSTEEGMLNRAYSGLRALGLLS